MKKLLVTLALLGCATFAQADGDTTVYKFGNPHNCSSEFNMCIYDHFITTKEEITSSDGMVSYLPMDYKNKSKLIELQESHHVAPRSLLIINMDNKGEIGERSALMYFIVNCKTEKYNIVGGALYSGLYGSGKQLHISTLDNNWIFPNNRLMKFAVSQLCR